jgi:hypothetical protein
MRPLFLLMLLPALCGPGCGYESVPASAASNADGSGNSAGPRSATVARTGSRGYHWSSLYRDDVHTVAVPIFTNRSFRRGVEFALTKAIVNQLEASTPYKVVGREHADTILEGEILDTHIRTISPDIHTGLPQDQLYIMRINFTWKDLRTGQMLVERRRFEQSSSYYPTAGEGIYVGNQQNVERLATAIVQELQADW